MLLNESSLTTQIRYLILIFMVALVVSGITAFPLLSELALVNNILHKLSPGSELSAWTQAVYLGVHETYSKYPFIAYGTDWLAFAHLVIAIAFIGPIKDPVRNIWIIQFGLMSCISIFPLAFIAGALRGIPFFWQLIDCSFGLVGFTLLWGILKKIKTLERIQKQKHPSLMRI